MSTRRVVAFLLASLAIGCKLVGSGDPKGNEVVALKPFEYKTLPELTLMFVDVEGDSRCPTSVQCVWAGDATVAVTAVSGNMPISAAKRFLHTNVEPRSLEEAGVTIRLDSLKPAPVTSDSIPQAQYIAYFTIVRR